MKKPILLVMVLLTIATLACSFNFSTAKINEAKMAKDPDGNQPTTTYAQDEGFYCVGSLANASDDTKLKAVWIAVEVEGVEPNLNLGEKELVTGGADTFNFSYINEEGKIWPSGKYKVDLYLNDKLDRSLEFQVEGSVTAVEPTPEPAATTEAEPTSTAEPAKVVEPTPTATTEATEEVVVATEESTSESTEQASSGDKINLTSATEEATPAATPLPFQEEPYRHPSGAFTFSLPESFKGIAGDKTSVSFGDDVSVVGAAFTNVGEDLNEKDLQTFIDAFTPSFMANFSDDYKILEQTDQPNGSILEAMSYTSKDGDGDVDIFFEEHDGVVFVLYFVSTKYAEMLTTWQKIVDSYAIDSKAALAATTAATPTPKPKPKPTQPASPAIPAGKGMLTYTNQTNVDFVVDVIGPTNGSQVVPPGQSKQFILDPGHYTINAHSAGGDFFVPSYEFDIAAGQLLRDGVQ